MHNHDLLIFNKCNGINFTQIGGLTCRFKLYQAKRRFQSQCNPHGGFSLDGGFWLINPMQLHSMFTLKICLVSISCLFGREEQTDMPSASLGPCNSFQSGLSCGISRLEALVPLHNRFIEDQHLNSGHFLSSHGVSRFEAMVLHHNLELNVKELVS